MSDGSSASDSARSESRPPGGCLLLTGATGLLGRYLVRDLSAAGAEVAVLVRPSSSQSAEARVCALCDDWLARTGVRPRAPRVLSGDLHADGLGLSDADRAWIGAHVGAVLHNAASLAFREGRDGEPFASNVGGVRRVLDLCEDTGVRTFHHVSTAYVAGCATGVVKEAPPDPAVPPGNVYEQSKRRAEALVRAAAADGRLDVATYLRPGIIVGDSATGLTTTFHGFYAFLRIAALIAGAQESSGDRRTLRLTLDGDERKHLVPVDWVGAAVAAIVTDPAKHGGVYHLTPRQPVTSEQIKTAVRAVTGVGPTVWAGADAELPDASDLERAFYDQTHVYTSYWRNDPTFDRARLDAALPDLPCPPVTTALLERLAAAAIAAGFRHRDRAPG